VTYLLAGAIGVLAALAGHDLAAQSLHGARLRPLFGSCPRCGSRRGWLAMECTECDRRVFREPLLAVVGAGGGALFALTIGLEWSLIAYLAFLGLSLALLVTDVDALRIVDRLNLRGSLTVVILLGLCSVADGTTGAFGRGLLGGVAYFAGTLVVFLAVRGKGFGFGDVKISAQLGVFTAYVSWGTLGWSVFLTALLGGVASFAVLLAVAIRKRRAPDRSGGSSGGVREALHIELPYGPWMILGAWIAISLAGLGAFPIPT
jgi:leader peptidase (prepilin peptidase) / N-methyltransferase